MEPRPQRRLKTSKGNSAPVRESGTNPGPSTISRLSRVSCLCRSSSRLSSMDCISSRAREGRWRIPPAPPAGRLRGPRETSGPIPQDLKMHIPPWLCFSSPERSSPGFWSSKDQDQHGREGAAHRQRLCGAVVAGADVLGGVPESPRQRHRGTEGPREVEAFLRFSNSQGPISPWPSGTAPECSTRPGSPTAGPDSPFTFAGRPETPTPALPRRPTGGPGRGCRPHRAGFARCCKPLPGLPRRRWIPPGTGGG